MNNFDGIFTTPAATGTTDRFSGVFSGTSTPVTEQTAGPTLTSKIVDRYKTGVLDTFQSLYQRSVTSPLQSTTLPMRAGGVLAGMANDAIGAAISPFIEKGLQSPTAQKALTSKVGGNIMLGAMDIAERTSKLFQAFEQRFPQEGQDIRDFANTATVYPFGLGAKVAKNTALDGFSAVSGTVVKDTREALKVKFINDLANQYREIAGTTVKSRNTLARSEARGKDPAQFLAERNVTPTIVDGKIQTVEQAKQVRESAQALETALDSGLREVQTGTPPLPLEADRARALRAIEEQNVTEGVRNAMRRDVNEEFDLLIQRYGPTPNLLTRNQIKRTYWRATPFDSTKPYQKDSNYLIGRSLKESIEEAVPESAFGVKELNSHLGDIYDAAKFLDSLEGKAVKGGRLGKYFARTIGAAVGAQGGITGGILGGIVGDRVAEVLQQASFSGPVKQLILRNLEKQDPAAYKKVMDFLKKAGLEREMRLLLPPPKAGQSTINQGRAIRQGTFNEGEYVGKDTVIGAPTEKLPPAPQSLLEGKPLDDTLPQSGGPSSAYGAFAGIQPDEEGNVSFNPLGAALGVFGMGMAKRVPTVSLKSAQSYFKEAKSLLAKHQPSSDFLKMVKDYVKYSDFGDLPEGETNVAKFVYGVRKAYEEFGYSDLTDNQLMRLSDAVLKAARDVPAKFQVSNPFGAKLKGDVPLSGTPSSKQSKADDMLTGSAPSEKGGGSAPRTDISDPFAGGLASEATKYQTADEFVKAQKPVYHGSQTPIKKFSSKQGTFFTDDEMNADGYGSGENVYEGYVNFKNPLVIDAQGRMWNDLKTPYGASTREVVANVDSKTYDGVIFKNIKDSWIDDADVQDPSTIYYAFDPTKSFLNEDQLVDLFNKVKGTKPPSDPFTGSSPSIPKELEGLAAEAKKYKSADDFIAAQGKPVYHGTKHQFDNFDPTKLGQVTGSKSARIGFYFTDNVDTARGYANFGDSAAADALKTQADELEAIARRTNKQSDWDNYYTAYEKYENEALTASDYSDRRVIEAYVSLKKPYVFDYKGKRFIDEKNEEIINKARKEGYDGVIFKNVADNVETTYSLEYEPSARELSNITVPFDVKSIKTKAQLTELFNKVKGTTK